MLVATNGNNPLIALAALVMAEKKIVEQMEGGSSIPQNIRVANKVPGLQVTKMP